MLEKLDDTNFLLYAAKHYDNPECFETLEFYDDLKKFKYLKRLLNRYKESRDLKERLVLNHVVVILNLFGDEAAVRMLFFKLLNYKDELYTILSYMRRMPPEVKNITHLNITLHASDMMLDETIVELLEKI
jgi:uncharacterized radical SAM superfamily protein